MYQICLLQIFPPGQWHVFAFSVVYFKAPIVCLLFFLNMAEFYPLEICLVFIQQIFIQPLVCMGFTGGSHSKESICNVGDLGSIPGLGKSPRGGHGNPLQHSCLENSMDRGAWWAAVHGVAKSRTQLRFRNSPFHSISTQINMSLTENVDLGKKKA